LTAEQDALLRTAQDAEVARRLGRSLSAACTRRSSLTFCPDEEHVEKI